MEWDADELLVLARLDQQKGNVEGALQKLKQARQLSEGVAAVDIELARLYAQVGLRRKAIPLFGSYLASSPSDIDARFQLGMAHFEEGDADAAMSEWDVVSDAQPFYPPALFFRATVFFRRGQTEAAKERLRAALEVLPADNLYFTRARELLAAIDAGIAHDGGASFDDVARKQH